jgi:hypothetical protein
VGLRPRYLSSVLWFSLAAATSAPKHAPRSLTT